jgi:hypothetical protein
LFNRQKEEGVLVRDGLVAEYRFDEGRGQVLCDYSGNGNHGQLGSTRKADTNDPLWTPQGLEFDGVDDYVDCGNKECLSIANNITMLGWIKRGVEESRHNTIFSKGNTESYIVDIRDNLLRFFAFNAGITVGIVSPPWDATTLYKDVWYHIATSHDGNIWRCYVNGNLDVELQDSRDVGVTSNPMWIGSRYASLSRSYQGEMALMHIYNRTFTPEEVLQNYEWSKTELAKRGVNLE